MSLHKKTALITGSTSGIGLAVANGLANAGYNIVLNGLTEEGVGESLAEDMATKYGTDVIFSPANLVNPKEIQQMMTWSRDEFGGIDVLVNNAGIQHVDPVESFPTEKWDAIIAINLSSSFHTIQNAIPHMQENGWGRIINIASVHGLVASVNKVAYCASKHGIIGLTKVIALENAEKGITCNAICPGWVETPLIQKQYENLAKANNVEVAVGKDMLIAAKQPSKQFIQPSHIADTVLFLCSEAGAGITGTSLTIDGGWTAQ